MAIEPELISLDALESQLRAVLPEEDRSPGIPPACYADDALLALERKAIFHRGWLGLGRCDRSPRAGDYSALDIAGVPVIFAYWYAQRLSAKLDSDARGQARDG